MGSQPLLLDSGRLKKNSKNTSRQMTPAICTMSARTSLYIILNLQSKRKMKTENFRFLLN